MSDYTTTAPEGEEATVYVEGLAYEVTYLVDIGEYSSNGEVYSRPDYAVECVRFDGRWYVAEYVLSAAMQAELLDALRTRMGQGYLNPLRRAA